MVKQVIYSIVHWLRTWSILQKPDLQGLVMAMSQQLGQMVKDIFSRHMGGDLVYELIVTRMCWATLFFVGCVLV